jgi:hypothetical protein
MTETMPESNPKVPPKIDSVIVAWMKLHGWTVAKARWEREPESGFHVWQETGKSHGTAHALWVSDSMVRRLSPEQLIEVLDNEEMDQEIRISLRMRIEERGSEYRISVVSRKSGEWKQEQE